MRRWTLAGGLAGLAAAVAAGLVLFVQRPIAVHVAKARRGPAVELVYATGYVEPEHPVTVSSRVTAPVLYVLVEEGDVVARGQALVGLDDTQQHALLLQAQAQAHGQTLQEERTVALHARGWVTRAARDTAVASGQSARAAAAAAAAQLDQMVVRAGISGIVLKREVEPGDLATPGKAMFQLGNSGRARVTATVDERDIPRVHAGQEALLSTDALPGRVMRGHVTEVTPGGDPSQRAFRVRIGLDTPSAMPFGLTLEVNLVARKIGNATLVPAGAVEGTRIWLVRDGRARHVDVRTGIKGAGKVQVLSGVSPGDLVIVNPPDGLEEGDRVKT